MRKLLSIILLVLLGGSIYAQEEEINVAGLVFLNYQKNLPDNILSSKSVVLVTSPNKAGESIAEDWHPMAEEAQPVFAKAGLDAVAYYFYDDVYSGKEVREAFATSWKKRGIKHIVLIIKAEVNGNPKNIRYLLMATPFNGQPSLMTEGQEAWKATGKEFKKVLGKLTKDAKKQESTNLMINDTPEYFNDVKLITSLRAETYYTDLNSGKLAVRKFAGSDLPGEKQGGLVNTMVKNRLEQAEAQAKAFNKEQAAIMQGYKFKYGMVEQDETDEALIKAGYIYVLGSIHTAGISVKRLLNYEVDEDEEFYITIKLKNGKPTMRYIPTKAPVYKYYIRNLKTGNIYVGKNWDADETWQESLKNMLYNIGKSYK
ncbi:MAG: hypothetical protein ABFS32_18960 [Bacteroidota bacterium]